MGIYIQNLALSTFLIIFATRGAPALPLGNPAEASLFCNGTFLPWKFPNSCDTFSFRFGFYGDYVFNRNLEIEFPGTPKSKKTEIYTNAAYLALNVCNRVDCFATLGTSQINLFLNPVIFSIIGSKIEVSTQTDLSWSIGLRGTVVKWCKFILGIEGQYFSYHPNLDSIFIAGIEPNFPFGEENVQYNEWQIGLGLSYRINIAANGLTAFVPYIGYKVSRSDFNFQGKELDDGTFSLIFDSVDLRNSRDFGGYAFGVTLVGCSQASITAEARFIEEKAFYVNGQLRF